jgi:hypothetical protein
MNQTFDSGLNDASTYYNKQVSSNQNFAHALGEKRLEEKFNI